MADVKEQTARASGGMVITPIGGYRRAAFGDDSGGDQNWVASQIDQGGYLRSAQGTPPLVSLNAVTATGAGTAFNLGSARANFGVQITTTGSPTSVSVALQGSLDGSTWTNIGSAITGTGTSLTFFTASPVPWIRLSLNTFSGGTSPTLTGIICAV